MVTLNVWEKQCSPINKQRLVSVFPFSELEETLSEGIPVYTGQSMVAGEEGHKQGHPNGEGDDHQVRGADIVT